MRSVGRNSRRSIFILPSSRERGFFTPEQLQVRTIESLKTYLRRRIGGYTVAIKYITTENLLYRGRVCRGRPSTIDEVSYPPPERVTSLGRANRVGQPMFYCCRGAFPVFFEIHVREGDMIAVSEWAVSEPLWMHNLGFHPETLEQLGGPIRPSFSSPIPRETNRNERLRRAMSMAFTARVLQGDEHLYKETIAINELLFDRASPIPARDHGGPSDRRAAGTVYPTVQMRGLADNIAVEPEFVDRYLRIRSVRYVQVEGVDHVQLAYNFLTVAHADTFVGRMIIWKDDLPPEKERRTRVAFEGGLWLSRDGYGRVYDAH